MVFTETTCERKQYFTPTAWELYNVGDGEIVFFMYRRSKYYSNDIIPMKISDEKIIILLIWLKK